MNIWFTADTHYGHANILKYCKRPFKSIHEMNEKFISNWNEVVDERDTIWHLGDFAFLKDPDYILRRLKGRINLIFGNHDEKLRDYYDNTMELNSSQDVAELRVGKKTTIWLSHYAHARWPRAHHGALHLFGHSHGNFAGLGRSMDVGVDCNNYYPFHIDEVIRKLEKLTPVEHHGED